MMPFYPAPIIRATISGRRRCRYVSLGEQCVNPMPDARHGHDGPHRFPRDAAAARTADLRARMAEAAAEPGERGAFWRDALADHDARHTV